MFVVGKEGKNMVLKMEISAKEVRKTILKIINNSGAAHIGSALSMVEMLNAVFKNLDLQKIKNKENSRDRIIFSKGHGTSALYAVMFHFGLLSEEELNTYFKNGSLLAGHASHHVPYVEHSTGGLGHGLPVGVGVAIGLKTKKIGSHVFVIVGDGEIQEGSNWEALMFAGHHKLSNLCVLVDCNRLSQVGEIEKSCTLEPLKSKFQSFNFNVVEVDGHNEKQIFDEIQKSMNLNMPTAILCHTIKGKGISMMENNNLWHYRCPKGEDYEKALSELEGQ